MFKAACIQMCSGTDIEKNLKDSEILIRQAAKLGADLILTPECTTLLQSDKKAFLSTVNSVHNAFEINFYQQLAKDLSIILVIGSIPIFDDRQGKALNRCYIFDQSGSIIGFYDKIHLFNVKLSDSQTWREADMFHAGKQAVSVKTSLCHLGLSICYDLRFPYLYRHLAHKGVECFVVPAAFTETTGKAHWKSLLRARSIENSAYFLAAAQTGLHEDGRKTWGHSMIIDPWGRILAEKKERSPGIIISKIKLKNVKKIRQILPSLKHDVQIIDH